jgi:methionyl-tRNA formyltransferase
MIKKDLKIVFLGRESGQIIKEKLQKAGFSFVDLKSKRVDLIVVGFYGKILSKKMLEIPKYGALNVHPSLLPKYRGPTPIQSTILNNETKTGVSIILMDEKADHGPIVAAETFKIGNKKFTAPELTTELWELGGDLLVKTIPKWIAGEIKPVPQNHENATYTKILRKQDGHIDWTKSAEEIERQIRAFTPWPGTFSFWKDRRVKILAAHMLKSADKISSFQGQTPGKVFAHNQNELSVQTGNGILTIDILQLDGKNAMNSKQFLNGHSDIIDMKLR